MTLKGLQLRIYPTVAQRVQLQINFGHNRFVWNQMLAMLNDRYQNNPDAKFPNAFALNNLLPALKQEYPWLKEAESTSLQATCHDLALAFQRLFKQVGGHPKFKSRKYPKQSYQCKRVGHNIAILPHHRLKVPKLGTLKFKTGQPVTGQIKNVTIKKTATQQYYAVLLVDTDVQPLPKTGQTVGVDMGLTDLMITSDGVKYPTIRFDKRLAKRQHYWEKRLARRRRQAQAAIAWDKHQKVLVPRELKDFKNYQKAKVMVAKYKAKVAHQRTNYCHQLTKQLVTQYDVIKIEDLKTKNLLHNHHLARAIANQSWRKLREQLTYKCAWYGKQLLLVNPYKTSQICADCGYDDGYHALSVRQWTCPNCGTVHDRDINAANNLQQAIGEPVIKLVASD